MNTELLRDVDEDLARAAQSLQYAINTLVNSISDGCQVTTEQHCLARVNRGLQLLEDLFDRRNMISRQLSDAV